MEPHDGLHTVNRDNNILLRSPTASLALYTTTPVRTFTAGKSRHTGGCTPKWAQFRRPLPLAVPTVLLSEKYSCTDRYSTIARHFPYGTSVCSSLTSENFGQNRYELVPQVFTLLFGLHHTVQPASAVWTAIIDTLMRQGDPILCV